MTIEARPSKSLVIKAKGGLGNRILSGVTGLLLARLQGRTPYIDWRDGMYVPSGVNLYPLLFDAEWMGDIEFFNDCSDVAPSVWAGRMTDHPTDVIHAEYPQSHQDPFIYRKLSVDLLAESPPNDVAVFWSYVSKLQRLKRQISVAPDCSHRSLDELASDLLAEHFTPVTEVSRAVDALFANLNGPVIGVHIRFTDRKAPLKKIMAALESQSEATPYATIFLATDSKEAEDLVVSRFPTALRIQKALVEDGGALHVGSKQFHDPIAEARNALIDMIALSRCDYLVHSSHSTFSVAASLFGRIAKRNQTDVDRFNARVQIKKFIQARA